MPARPTCRIGPVTFSGRGMHRYPARPLLRTAPELVLGFTEAGRPLHVQCSYPSRPLVKIITLYEPDPERWVDFRTRKPD